MLDVNADSNQLSMTDQDLTHQPKLEQITNEEQPYIDR